MSDPATPERLVTWEEMLGLVQGLSRTCAASSRHADAPISQELFRRIGDEGQRLVEATRLLGLWSIDGAYLLAGLRRDIATELVVLLLNVQTSYQNFADQKSDSRPPN